MDIAVKYKIVEKIIQSNDDNLLNEINSLLSLSDTDYWSDLPKEVKQAVDKSKAELDIGGGIPHADVMAEVKSRFPG